MAQDKQKLREKTKTPGIYYNTKTKLYDVKYNFTVYDTITQKNKQKSKWSYNNRTIGEAKTSLAMLKEQFSKNKIEDKSVTLKGAYELWKVKATAQNFSPASLKNTQESFKMLTKYLHEDTLIKNITEDTYYQLITDLRNHGYAEESLHTINATFRKLVNLCFKKRLIIENPLHRAEALNTEDAPPKAVIPIEDFQALDDYFRTASFYRLGIDNYPKARLLFNILYYTGLRIGEALALNYNDFEEIDIPINYSHGTPLSEHFSAKLHITKSYLSAYKVIKSPKNKKTRTIPVHPDVIRLFRQIKHEHEMVGGSLNDRIFNWSQPNCQNYIKKACKECGFDYTYSCHQFRHTFISNLINQKIPLPIIEAVSGDTKETILKHYAHLFKDDEWNIIEALNNVKRTRTKDRPIKRKTGTL